MRFSKYLAPLAVVAGMAGLGSPAHAVLILNIAETGGGSISITDNTANDVNPLIDMIEVNIAAVNAALQFFDVTTLGTSSNSPGSTSVPQVFNLTETGSVFRTLGTTGNQTLTVSSSDTDFTVLAPNLISTRQLSGTVTFTNAGTGDSTLMNSYNDPQNRSFQLANPLGLPQFNATGTPNQGTNQSFSGSIAAIPPAETVFSMTDVTVITLGAPSSDPLVQRRAQFTVSQTKTTTPIPEPGTMVMALSGLPLLGLALRRRLRRTASVA